MPNMERISQAGAGARLPEALPAVSHRQLEGGFGRSQLDGSVLAMMLASVAKVAHKQGEMELHAIMPKIRREAEKSGLSISQYLVELAMLYESTHGRGSQDLLLGITRFQKVLGGNGFSDYEEVIQSLDDVKKNLAQFSLQVSLPESALDFLKK